MSSYYEKMLATGEVKCIDEEIPFEIPQGWEWCRMRDVIQLLSGRDLEPSMYNSSQKGIPYITGASNFNNENLIVNRWTQTPVTVSEEGDLLITCKGTIGTMAFNNIGSIHIARQIMAIHSKDVDLHYLKLYFELNIGTLESQANSMIPGISREVVLNSLVPIPPLQEQIKIVEKSNSLMPLVSKYSFAQGKLNLLNNVIKNKLEKTILQEAIKGKLVPQIAEEGTAHELLEQIKAEKQKLVKEGKLKKSTLNDSVIFRGDDNKYWEKKGTTCECIDEDIPFDIPKSWAWARLETILNTGSARRVHAKDWRQAGIPFYRAREIGKLADDGFVDNELYIDLSLYEDFSSSGVPLPNDLMITAVGTLGKVYIVKESDKFYYKDGSVLCLANKYGLCAEFLKMVIESPSFKGQYRQESQGTTVATLTMVRLQKYFIPLPPLQEQYRIVEMYRNIASIMS
ncbi:restriction endonuclease subunit S [Segatella copri]|uniref:restriction endonuclease subunit S n=1 Tax=Segatella copri TaxID=165179 RepID=UPI002FEFD594